MQRFEVPIELELPDGVQFREYQRVAEGHGFHVSYAPPASCQCDHCALECPANISVKNTFYTCRDVDIWRQPAFFVYQPLLHACPKCGHRQHVTPPFRRKDASYTFRFEAEVLRLLRGSTAEQTARELAIDAETVERIVAHQIADAQAKQVDAARTIVDVGIDEISLKKRHKLYATLLWDLSEPGRPNLLAAAEGRDEAAVRCCLEKLSAEQRAAIKTLRSDMGPAMLSAQKLLPNAQSVIDRFHVAQKLGESADALRKKHAPP